MMVPARDCQVPAAVGSEEAEKLGPGCVECEHFKWRALSSGHTGGADWHACQADAVNVGLFSQEQFECVKGYVAFHDVARSEEHTSELQSRGHLVCRLLLEKKKQQTR